jgi:hypothetical protein
LTQVGEGSPEVIGVGEGVAEGEGEIGDEDAAEAEGDAGEDRDGWLVGPPPVQAAMDSTTVATHPHARATGKGYSPR